MSDLKKWLEAVSNEDAEHQADIDTQVQLKDEEDIVVTGDDEKLADDTSKTDAEAEVKAEGSDTAVSVEEEDTASELIEEDTVDETEVDEAPVEAPEAEVSEVTDEIVEQVEETTDTEVDETDPVVEDPEVEVPVDTVDDTVEPTVVDESGDTADPVETATDSEEPILEVDPVAEIKEGEAPVPVEEETTVAEDDDSFEDFDSVADAHITDDMDGVEQDIDDMDSMTTALEAYGELLAGEMDRKNGVVDPTLVRAIQIGLESFGEPLLTEGVPSLEDFSDPSGQYVVSLEFAEGLKGKAGKIAQATMGALKRLWELLEDIFRQFKANIPALQMKNDELSEKLKNTVDGSEGGISMKGARRLYIGDMFAGNNPSNIKTVYEVGDKFMVLYPKMFRDITNEYKQLTKGLMSDKDSAKSISAFTIAITKHLNPGDLGLQQINPSKAPSDMQKYAGIAASPVLLGNRRFFAGVNNVKIEGNRQGDTIQSDSSVNAMVYMADYFKLTFGTEAGVPDSGKDDVVKLPDVSTLRQLVAETTTLTKHLKKYVEATGVFSQIRREMQQETAKLHGLDKLGSHGQINSLAILSQGISRAITVPTGHFVGYVGNVVRLLQAFIEYCIREHEAAVTDV